MKIQEGDTVKVITANSMHEGSTGKVVRVFEDEKTCTVRIEKRAGGTDPYSEGVVTGFYMHELELVESTGRDGQIAQIAAVLKKEEIRGWTDEDYTATATSLYASGVRYDADQ